MRIRASNSEILNGGSIMAHENAKSYLNEMIFDTWRFLASLITNPSSKDINSKS